MKLKHILLLALIPFTSFAANTNQFDNVLIKNNIVFTGGVIGVNKILTSDAAGNYTPQTLLTTFPTLVTNITGDSIFPFTGAGTHSFVLTPNYSINVTNGANVNFNNLTVSGISTFNGMATNNASVTFNAPNTYNAVETNNFTIVASNIIMRGGTVFARTTRTANYTNTIFDYMNSWRPTTAAVTNFLPTGVLNGRTYVIKDAASSASSTNIFIKPLGTDTIDGTNQFILNINKQSVTITYDGVSNWEMQ